jgi:hypothetical protein
MCCKLSMWNYFCAARLDAVGLPSRPAPSMRNIFHKEELLLISKRFMLSGLLVGKRAPRRPRPGGTAGSIGWLVT